MAGFAGTRQPRPRTKPDRHHRRARRNRRGPEPAEPLAGADAVLSALGPRTKADAGVAARGTKVITQAMQAAGLFVSRADVAYYMLSILDQPGTFRQTIGIAN